MAQNLARKSYLVVPIYMKILPKVKLSKVRIGLNIAQNHLASLQEVIYSNYFLYSYLTPICHFSHIYTHLPIFTPI